MARLLRTSLRDEHGLGIPTAMFVTLTVFVLGATWARIAVHSADRSAHDRSREQALQAAEAGVNAAMSRLTVDAAYAGGSGSLPDRTGDYDVAVAPVAPGDLRRLITATGHAPERDAKRVVSRRLEAQVDLEPGDGFTYALFAGTGVLTGDNHMTVTGDVYGRDGVALANNTDIHGDVVSPSWVTVDNNTLVTGDIRAGGDVTLELSATTVQGSVYSHGNVVVKAHVEGDVQAAGSVTVQVGGQVDGDIAEYSTPPPVRTEALPEFTWDPADYSPAPSTWSSASAFKSHWQANANAFSGHHRITDTAQITLDSSWTMSDDVTIVSDGMVKLTRDVTNAGSDTLYLVIVSFSEQGIEFTNNVTLPNSVKLLLFAQNGPVVFRNLKNFSGSVYARSIEADQNLTLSHSAFDVPGFSWSAATDVHYRVAMRVLREVRL